jgi:hypothetical protein
MNGTNQQAFFSQQQLGISIGEFRSGEMLVEELANDQEVLQTTATGSVDKSWFNNVNDQQTSKLDLSNGTEKNDNIKVDTYFKNKSFVPDYLIKNDENNSLLNFSKEFLSQSAVEKQNNETINNTDFTLSGTTIVDNSFSFTLNSSDTGDFIIKIDKNKPEKEANLNINSTLKSESVGMRPPLLTAKPINSVNMQEISDNLDKIEHSILNRKEDQKQVSSTTFKSTNKSTKHQLS